MRQPVRELCIFGVGPFLVAFLCLYGVIGGFTTSETFVPLYAIGLIASVTTLGIYSFASLFRLIRWCTRPG